MAAATGCLQFRVESVLVAAEEDEEEEEVRLGFDLSAFLAKHLQKEVQVGSVTFRLRVLEDAEGMESKIESRVTFCFVSSVKMAETLFKKEEPTSKGSKRRATMAGMSSGGGGGFAGVLSPSNCNASGFLDSDARGLCSEKKRFSLREKSGVEKVIADALSRKAIFAMVTEIDEEEPKSVEGSLKILEKLRAIN